MPNTDQAQADPTDETTVMDPLDAMDTQEFGTSELSAYEAEVASLSLADLPGDEPEDDANEDEDDSTEDDESTEDSGEEANEESSEEDATEEGEPATSNRFRIRAKDDIEAEALALRKRHPDLSLKECIAKAELILGVEVESGETTTSEKASVQGDTVDSVTEQIKELQRKRREAITEMEFETQAELTEQIEELLDKRADLKISEARAKAEAEVNEQASFDKQYKESMRKAVSHYPDATNPDSAMTKRIIQLDAEMLEMGDPLYHSPDKPFLLAKAAARDLGIIMTKPGAVKAPAKAPRSQKSPIQPVSGSRGTIPTDSNQQFEAELDGIDTLEAYESRYGRG